MTPAPSKRHGRYPWATEDFNFNFVQIVLNGLNLPMTILGRAVINEGVKENGILAIEDKNEE